MKKDKIILSRNILFQAQKAGFNIRPAQTDDINNIRFAIDFAFDGTNAAEALEGDVYCLIATLKNHNNEKDPVIGVIIYSLQNKNLSISDLGVIPTHSKKGIASFLMASAIHHAKCLGCDASNLFSTDEAHKLYEKFGYTSEGKYAEFMKHQNLKQYIRYPILFGDARPSNDDYTKALTSDEEDNITQIQADDKHQKIKK